MLKCELHTFPMSKLSHLIGSGLCTCLMRFILDAWVSAAPQSSKQKVLDTTLGLIRNGLKQPSTSAWKHCDIIANGPWFYRSNKCWWSESTHSSRSQKGIGSLLKRELHTPHIWLAHQASGLRPYAYVLMHFIRTICYLFNGVCN